MLWQLVSCAKSDIKRHKLQALQSVLEYIYHADTEVTEAAVQCLSAFADCVGDKVAEVSQKLLDFIDTNPSESLR